MEKDKKQKLKSSSRLKQSFARLLRRTACATTSDAAHTEEPVFVSDHPYHLNNLPLTFTSLEPHRRALSDPLHYSKRPSLHCGRCRPASHSNSKKNNYKTKVVMKKERRVTEIGSFYETGEHEGRRCPPASPISPSKNSQFYFSLDNADEEKKKKKKRKKKKKKLLSNAYGFSSSSSSDEELGGLFSSEDGEEGKEDCSEKLFSSKSFSSDSSEFYQRPLSIASKRITKKVNKKKDSSSSRRQAGYRPLVSMISSDDDNKKKKKKKEKKVQHNLVMDVNEGDEEHKEFAVVKQTKDPYGDFRCSMLEMIVERQTFSPGDLRRLLNSYISLNSCHHHPIILQAFSDIWEALFSN